MPRTLTLVPAPSSPAPPPPGMLAGEEDSGRRWGVWIVIILLALLLHLLVFMAHVDWAPPATPPPVEVQQIDPAKLDQIRKMWKDKSLLIDKNHSQASDQKPENARYFSDHDIHVEKEQRARDHVVLPKPGSQAQQAQQAQAPSKRSEATRSQPLPNLGNLGVPFRLGETPRERADGREMRQQQAQAAQPGGEQYIDDKNLPMGSENMLNAEESVYYSFYARLYEAIGPVWESRLREIASGVRVQPGDYTTSVDVVLDKDGSLLEVRLLQSSRISEFDKAVDDAWHKLGPFPNPPSGLIQADGHVHTGWNFTVQVGGGAGMMLMPPQRTY